MRSPQHLRSAHAEPLALEIHGLLTDLVEATHSFLMIDLPSCGRYVQFLTEDGNWLRGETIGSRFIEEYGPTLSVDDDALLVRFGWEAAGSDEGNCGNYWQMWDAVDIAEAAQLAALTITRIHGMRVPDSSFIAWGRTATWPGAESPAG